MGTLLDLAIGLVFVYVFFSMIASGITEWISRLFKLRAKVLANAIRQLLGSAASNGQLAALLYSHPLIAGLADKSAPGPTYIPSSHFALALMDLAVQCTPGADATSKPQITGAVAFKAGEKQLVESIIQGLSSPADVQRRIEKWFEESMERVSGQYKRRTYWSLLLISLAVSIGLGVDTIRLSKDLYNNNSLRAAVTKKAQTAVEKSTDPAKADISIAELDLPIGWPKEANKIFFLGCIITAFGLTLGSPFWFDLLGRLVNLRQTGVPPDMKDKIVAH